MTEARLQALENWEGHHHHGDIKELVAEVRRLKGIEEWLIKTGLTFGAPVHEANKESE